VLGRFLRQNLNQTYPHCDLVWDVVCNFFCSKPCRSDGNWHIHDNVYNMDMKPVVFQGRFYVGAGGTCPLPKFTCCSQIQKIADYSDVISEVPKCSKIQIFRLQRSPDPLADGERARCPLPRTPPHSRPFGPSFYGSQGLTHTELATLLMIDFKCRPI